ncbi:MFS transporter [Paenibacillus thalictri]|uniref:MFS transporter n=1 Tax=Paenibacillus thalictri TaxID=2527873 RepID=A0A4Q9DRB8_9BACL|nr:MFS transporter [Paenibacillus thalictri]TBL79164.1 MFS transporter [Paenibacillus thalictri]
MKVEQGRGVPDQVRTYAESLEKLRQLHKKTLVIVVLSQMFGGAGLAAGVTVGALLAQQMLGTDSFAGVPAALFTLGSAAAALAVGRLSQKFGRRAGLAAGFLTGSLGAVGIVIASVLNSLPLLFLALLIYGAGTATNLQARYAGTDLALPTQRAKAISTAMVFTTFGAVAGPNLVDVMGRVAAAMSIPPLAGPFLLAAAAYLLAGLVLLFFLRPDPLIVAKAVAENMPIEENTVNTSAQTASIRKSGLFVGASVMVLTQIVMVAIMTMTPVHMKHNGHGMSEVGIVIGIHIAAMYLPSLVTGYLVDKYGRTPMSYASGITLLLAGMLAAWAPHDSMVLLVCALALLGLGWNFGLISGTATIVDATPASVRAKTQGTIDVLIALAGASGGAMSGIVAAQTSYSTLSLAGGFLSLLLIPVVIWKRERRKN